MYFFLHSHFLWWLVWAQTVSVSQTPDECGREWHEGRGGSQSEASIAAPRPMRGQDTLVINKNKNKQNYRVVTHQTDGRDALLIFLCQSIEFWLLIRRARFTVDRVHTYFIKILWSSLKSKILRHLICILYSAKWYLIVGGVMGWGGVDTLEIWTQTWWAFWLSIVFVTVTDCFDDDYIYINFIMPLG